MAKKQRHSSMGIIPIEVKGLAGLCRYVYNFDFTSENLLAYKFAKADRVIALEEKIGKTS